MNLLTEHRRDSHEALRPLGWVAPRPGSVSGLHVDASGGHDVHFGRAWTPAGVWHSLPHPGRLSVVLVTEGECHIDYLGEDLVVDENHVVLLDAAVQARVSFRAAAILYLWNLDAASTGRMVARSGLGTPVRVERAVWRPLTALSNALLVTEPAVATSLNTARSVEHLLTAVLTATPSWAPTRQIHVADIFEAALELIQQKKHLPHFSAQDIARQLGVSDRRLQRIFARYSTTARRELERRRVRDLRDAISTAAPEALENRRAFALLTYGAGFATAAHGRAALRRSETAGIE